MRKLIFILFYLIAVYGYSQPQASGSHAKFGVLVFNISGGASDEVLISKALVVRYIRGNVVLPDWGGGVVPPEYRIFIDSGMKVVYNVLGISQAVSPRGYYVTLNGYIAKLNSLLDIIPAPELLVLDNEELNDDYHGNTPKTDYITLINAAVPIIHAKGYKCTNGGLTRFGLDVNTFRYLKATYGSTVANQFASECMSSGQTLAADNPGGSDLWDRRADTALLMLNAYKIFDYVNIHFYEPLNTTVDDSSQIVSAVVLKYRQEYITKITGRPVITNEWGQKNISNTVVLSLMEKIRRLRFAYGIEFDGDGAGGARGLHENTYPYPTRPNGDSFTAFNIGALY